MKRTLAISMVLLVLGTAFTQGPSSSPAPPPEVQKWGVWIGDWSLSGTARDTPMGAEYKVDWRLRERWILGGAFVQVEQVWKGNGQELQALEILGYDPDKKIHTVSGFASDGSTWYLTAKFEGAKTIEDGTTRAPDGTLTTCHTTFMFSGDGMSLSGVSECEQSGVRWTAFRVRGAKTKAMH